MEHEHRARHLVLLSGGLDSAAALALLKDERCAATALTIDYGQAAREQELRAAKAVSSHYGVPLEVITVRHGRSLATGEVAGRNAFLISTAACLSETRGGLIVTGIHAGTRYYDCSTAFLDSMSRLIEEQSDGARRLLSPFAEWSKVEVFAFAKKANLPIALTYSCEAGTDPPCGLCASCRDREAL